MTQRILFVDDEPAVLQGLRRMLHERRQGWEMSFVGSGQEALASARQNVPDVVVTDMRMPNMDGAELLSQFRQLFPQTLRIILSGQTDLDQGLKKIEGAHVFLHKPCEKTELTEAIDRAARTESWVPDTRLRSEIAQLSRLPMLGEASRKLMEELERPGCSLRKAAALVEEDPGMAAMALKMIHSAVFATRVRVERPAQAALLLGLENLKGLVLGSEPFQALNPSLQGLSERLWQAGTQAAFEAKNWVGRNKGALEQEHEAFTAGMLHEVGVLVLATLRPALAKAWEEAHPQGWPGGDLESAHFGADHASVGGYLLSLWGLSESLASAVRHHHALSGGDDSLVRRALQHAVSDWERSSSPAPIQTSPEKSGLAALTL